MAKNYVPLHGDIKNLSAAEVRAWLGGLADNEIIRSIIIAEIEAVRAGQSREMRTLRGFWYEIVKPILSRLGVLNKKTSSGNDVAWDRILSERLGDIVKAGLTSYEELAIIDGSRQRISARNIPARLVDVGMVGGHYPWVIMFTEKDTIWPVIQNLATLYGVSAISGGGQPALSCSENITREIMRTQAYQAAQPENLIILSLTDYDPAGYSIADAQFNQVLNAASNAPTNERGKLKGVKSRRLGLEPSQLTADELAANAYTPKDKGLNKWVEEVGGINGQPLGLELDSLPLSRLREMFALAIEEHIDISKRIHDLKSAFINLTACDILLPDFEKRRAEMIRAAEGSQAGEVVYRVQVPDNLFLEAAINGAGWIGPDQVRELFSDYEADIRQAMQNGKNTTNKPTP